MIRLADKLYTNGCWYTLVRRVKRACIYIGRGRYEVFLIKTRPEETIKGKLYPKREGYPSTNDWGFTAWTYIKFENALKHFNKLVNIY